MIFRPSGHHLAVSATACKMESLVSSGFSYGEARRCGAPCDDVGHTWQLSPDNARRWQLAGHDDRHRLRSSYPEHAVPWSTSRPACRSSTDNLDPEETDLRQHLAAACTVMGMSFPEYDERDGDAVKKQLGLGESSD